MKNIIIYGNSKSEKILNIIVNYLKEKYCLNIFYNNEIYTIGAGNSINIILSENIKKIFIKNAIIIVNNGTRIRAIKFIDSTAKIIINDCDTRNIMRFSNYIKNIFTCGFCKKDYITFSSRNESGGSISLQRNIEIRKNVVCEPFEIPCDFDINIKEYEILSVIMSLILLEEINAENTKKILLCSKKPQQIY